MSKIIIQAVKGGTIITVDGLKINPYTLDSGLFLKKDNYTSNYPGSITYTVVDKAGERAFNPELLSNITLISLNSEETIPKNEEELLNILSEFDGFKKFGASSGGKGNSIVGAGIDCINKKIELKMSDGTDFPIDLSCMFQDVVRSTFGYAEVFPENPKAGQYFELRSLETDKVLKVFQFNGVEWIVVYDFVYNFSAQFSSSSISNYDSAEKFKNIYGNSSSISLSNYKYDSSTNVITANIIQDFTQDASSALSLNSITEIKKLSNDYAFNVNIDDNYTFEKSLIFSNYEHFYDLYVYRYNESNENTNILKDLIVTNNARLRNVDFSNGYGDALDSIEIKNNSSESTESYRAININTKFNNLIITDNNTLSSLYVSSPINTPEDTSLDLTGNFNLNGQVVLYEFRVSNIDFSNAKTIVYPKLTNGSDFSINECSFTESQFTDLYNYLLNATDKNITVSNSSNILFTDEQKTTLLGLGYTINQ